MKVYIVVFHGGFKGNSGMQTAFSDVFLSRKGAVDYCDSHGIKIGKGKTTVKIVRREVML